MKRALAATGGQGAGARTFGAQMKGSWITRRPYASHALVLVKLKTENASGIDAADRSRSTDLIAARGPPNITTHTAHPV